VVGEVEPAAVVGREPLEDLGGHDYHGPPDPDPDQDANQGGDQCVHGALDEEAADQPPALHADRPQHAELGFSLLGQHHEDVHQQHPGDDREAADEQEQRPQAVASPLGAVEHALLGLVDRDALGGERAERGLELGLDGVAATVAALHVAGVGHEGERPRLSLGPG
jgi:hypothetical protein